MRPRSSAAAVMLMALLLSTPPCLAQTRGRAEEVRPLSATARGESTRADSEAARPKKNSGPGPVFAALESAFSQEDPAAVVGHLPRMEIPFELEPPGAKQADSRPHQRRSREQIFYLLREFFDRREVDEAHFIPSKEEGSGDAHGVLQLTLEDSPTRRLFLRLRRMKGHWKVAELRALP